MTEIEVCPKCKKRDGYTWHWGDISASNGHATCNSCGAKFT